MTPRKELQAGLICLGLVATVIGMTLWKRTSWSIDGIEAIVILLPFGIYFVLKGGFGYDILADLKRLFGFGKKKDEAEET
jgi:uncharacterized membrane protein